MPGPIYYDLYDNGKLVGRYSGEEIRKRFGWKFRYQVDKYSDMGTLYQGEVPDRPGGHGDLGG